MESAPTSMFGAGHLRWFSRIASIPVACWLIWTGWSGWDWYAVLFGGIAFALLATIKSSLWSGVGWRKAANDLGRPRLAPWLAAGLVPFNMLLALAFHAAARGLSLLI
jgi:hypothetical protein